MGVEARRQDAVTEPRRGDEENSQKNDLRQAAPNAAPFISPDSLFPQPETYFVCRMFPCPAGVCRQEAAPMLSCCHEFDRPRHVVVPFRAHKSPFGGVPA
jgi:hypothetical protein